MVVFAAVEFTDKVAGCSYVRHDRVLELANPGFEFVTRVKKDDFVAAKGDQFVQFGGFKRMPPPTTPSCPL